MALATLVIWVFLGVGAMGHILKEKMKLSSHCVHRVLRLQNDLKKPLVQILKLNPRAKRLRVQQAQTQKRLARAVATAVATLLVKEGPSAKPETELSSESGRATFGYIVFAKSYVGGGPSGLTAALVAHREGANVTLIEKRDFHYSRPVWFDLEPGDDPYRHFLAQYGARLRELVRVQSGRRARPDSRRGVQRPSDSGRVARPSDSGRVPRPSSGRVPPTSDSGRVPRPLLDERPQKTARDTERVRRYVERSSPSAAGKALLEQQLAAMQAEEDYPDEPDMNLEAEMLPSDDMSRVYLVQKMIGRGGQGYVFEVAPTDSSE